MQNEEDNDVPILQTNVRVDNSIEGKDYKTFIPQSKADFNNFGPTIEIRIETRCAYYIPSQGYIEVKGQLVRNDNNNRYSTYGEHKTYVVERANRTLREKMWKSFTAENTRNWVDMLDRLITEYNNTVHSTIGMIPVKCSKLKSFETKPITEKGLKKPKFLKLDIK